MSYQTVHHEVSVSKDQLLKLFLGQGDLLICLRNQKIILDGISDRHVLYVIGNTKIHYVKIHGTSDEPGVSYVDGQAEVREISKGEVYLLTLEINLQDDFE